MAFDEDRPARTVHPFDPVERPARRSRARDPEPKTFAAPTGLCWTVEPPRRAQATLGAKRPSGRLVVREGDATWERRLPAAVARGLLSEKDFGGAVGTAPELLERADALAKSCAAQRLLRLVDKRDYAEDEARRKLLDDGYDAQVVEDVVSRARAGRLIDDRRFADSFIRGKVSQGWGAARIERELKRRGVEPDSVPGWPGEYLGDDEAERAWEILSRRSVPAKNPYEKSVRFLVGRGFSFDVAKRCAARLVDGDGD